jgi:hypothetical protein
VPVVKLMGQVHRAVCDRECGWKLGGLKWEAAQARLGVHMLEHKLTDEAYAIMDEAGFTGDRNVVVQVWKSLTDQHHALGQTRYAERIIVIEHRLATFDAYDDTLRHEVAHWIAWYDYGDPGHGPGWVRACGRTGALPQRGASSSSPESLALVRFAYECDMGCIWLEPKRHRSWLSKVCGQHGAKVHERKVTS